MTGNIATVVQMLMANGEVKLLCNGHDDITHLCFAQQEQQCLFNRFPHVVNVDATHGTDREK